MALLKNLNLHFESQQSSGSSKNIYRTFLRKLFQDIDRVSFLGEPYGKNKPSLREKFIAGLHEAETKFDNSKGIKSNGGSLPFSKIPVNKYASNFDPKLVERIKKDLERDLEKPNPCKCLKNGFDCGEGNG